MLRFYRPARSRIHCFLGMADDAGRKGRIGRLVPRSHTLLDLSDFFTAITVIEDRFIGVGEVGWHSRDSMIAKKLGN
jgi:hypothetical protein